MLEQPRTASTDDTPCARFYYYLAFCRMAYEFTMSPARQSINSIGNTMWNILELFISVGRIFLSDRPFLGHQCTSIFRGWQNDNLMLFTQHPKAVAVPVIRVEITTNKQFPRWSRAKAKKCQCNTFRIPREHVDIILFYELSGGTVAVAALLLHEQIFHHRLEKCIYLQTVSVLGGSYIFYASHRTDSIFSIFFSSFGDAFTRLHPSTSFK